MNRLVSCAPCRPTRSRRWPSRCASTAVVMVLLALLVLVGCSVPSDDEAQAIDPSRLESTATPKRSCVAPVVVDGRATTVYVYLVSQQSDPPNVKPVPRIVENAEQASAFVALEALFECIVPQDDRRTGLATAIPDQTRLLALRPVNPADGTYEVQLGPLRNRAGQKVDDLDKLAVAQIFFTATGSDPAVTRLRFTIDGRPVAVNTDRRTVGQTDSVIREDFIASSPPSLATTTSTTRPATATTAATGALTTVRAGAATTVAGSPAPTTTRTGSAPTAGNSAPSAPGTTR